MSNGTVSVRYATALLQYASENGCEREVYDSMLQLRDCIAAVPQLMLRLKDPMTSKADKVSLLNAALTTADGSGPVKVMTDFFALVADRGRCDMISFMANSYRDLYRRKHGIVTAEITTSVPLDDRRRDSVRKLAGRCTCSEIEWVENVNPDIVGGFILKVDDIRMDASVSRRLERIRKELIEKNSRII